MDSKSEAKRVNQLRGQKQDSQSDFSDKLIKVLGMIGRDEEPLGIFFQEQVKKIFTKTKM